MSDMWSREWCPSCEKPNWISLGDLDDLTVPDIEGLECHSCGHKWFIVDVDLLADLYAGNYDPENGETLEDCVVWRRGIENPNG